MLAVEPPMATRSDQNVFETKKTYDCQYIIKWDTAMVTTEHK